MGMGVPSRYPGWCLPPDVGNPADQMVEMRRREPYEDAPVAHHVAWHERMAALWDRLTERDAMFAQDGPKLAEWHRSKAKEFVQRRSGQAG